MNAQDGPRPMTDIGNRVLIFSVLVLAMVALPVPVAWAESRIALVIGNGAYRVDPLSNPVNDAGLMSRTLRSLGFEVELKTDVGEKQMRRLVEDFGQRLKRPGAVGVFYYSGHGMQVNGRNYMIPMDADIKREVDVRSDGVDASSVLWWMEQSGSDRNIVILDACRDNPFEKSFKSGRKGLARMDAPTGTLIAYAAAPGAVADQGPRGGRSPFTEVLAEEMVVAGSDARILFDKVSFRVLRDTKGRQRPYTESSAFGEFYFSRARVSPRPAVPPRAKPAVGVYPKTFQPGETFEDCDVCPKMVVVPAGSFTMGSPPGEKGRRSNHEGPQHRVTIAKPFAVGKYEVTFAEWDACVDAGGCNGHRPRDEGWGRGRRPVINVSWNDARAYVKWLSNTTGKNYRLLTEAEWEYAARAGTTTPFHFGRTISPDQANYFGESNYDGGPKGVYREKTVPVGGFSANAFGLHDMHGNVGEWVEDVLHKTYAGAPYDGSAWTKGGAQGHRILRGGSWENVPSGVRSAKRSWGDADERNNVFGFRVARTF